MKVLVTGALVATMASQVQADVVVRFDEGAPKDRFTISNSGTCPLDDVEVVLDLGASAAGLIFDVTGSGAGVSVFQPLELVAGQELLAAVPDVRDGDNRLALPVKSLAPGASIAFTIDVDDTAGVSETMVSGAEISGANVVVKMDSGAVEARFDGDAVARVPLSACSA